MAAGPHVLVDASVTIDAVDVSEWVRSVTIEQSKPEVDITGMGAAAMQYAPGIPDATITLEVLQAYGAAEIDATLNPLYVSGDTFVVVVKPFSAAVGADNPSYTMTGRLFTYNPVAGSIGDANTTTVTIRNADPSGIVRAVA